MAKSLLQKIKDKRAKEHPSGDLSQELLEEYEVLLAWVEGDVDSAEAASALNVSTGQLHQKAGTAMRNLRRSGYITVTWNPPEPEESVKE